MEDYRLGVVEGKFAQLIWDKEPLTSRELVELCAKGNRELIQKQKELLGEIL